MRTGRPKADLRLTPEDRATLIRWTARPKTGQALALRARIILRCADGAPNIVVARQLRIGNKMVGKWRARFGARGPAGLLDERRSGTPRRGVAEPLSPVPGETREYAPPDAPHPYTPPPGAA